MPNWFNALWMDTLRLMVWALLLGLVFVPLEHWFAQRRQPVLRRGLSVDAAYFFMSGLLPKWLLALPLALTGALAVRLVPPGWHAAVAEWPLWLRFGLTLVVGDICAYWGHRMMHQVPALWRFHAVHHSAPQMDWMVNTRAHPFDLVLVRLAGIIPLQVLGLAQPRGATLDLMTATYLAVGTTWSFLVHANLRWRFGWLEQLVALPAFHHWHHTNDGPEVVDRNYAAVFPWVDRLFGTLYLPPDRWPQRYGTDTPVADGLLAQLVDPLRGGAAPVAAQAAASASSVARHQP